jgi:hypothetical protein
MVLKYQRGKCKRCLAEAGLQPILVWGLKASVLQWTISPTHQSASENDYSSNRKTCKRSICSVPTWMVTRSIKKHCVASLIAIDGDTKNCVTSLIVVTTCFDWGLSLWHGDFEERLQFSAGDLSFDMGKNFCRKIVSIHTSSSCHVVVYEYRRKRRMESSDGLWFLTRIFTGSPPSKLEPGWIRIHICCTSNVTFATWLSTITFKSRPFCFGPQTPE